MGRIHDGFVAAMMKVTRRLGRPVSDEEIQDTIDGAVSKIVESLFETLDADTPEMLSWHKSMEQGFNERLAERWKKGFDLMTKLGVMCRETGEITLKECRLPADSPEVYKFEALSRLHARACLIYMEALCLMKGGFADGAMARWRSLHEAATVALYLAESETELSERFLGHQFVEKKKRLRDYKANAERLGLEPFDRAEEGVINQQYQRVVARFGEEFKGNYGWAAEDLGKGNPTFWDIEQRVGIDHLRPYYKWACEKIHASTNGLYSSLGLDDNEELMLVGPSNYGLTDPAQLCAMSLVQATVAFASRWENLDLLVLCKACQAAKEPIAEVFLAIQEEIERDEMALRKRRAARARRRKHAKVRKKALREVGKGLIPSVCVPMSAENEE